MINRTVLVGRLTRDPEFRRTAQGDAVTSFTLAVNRNYTSNDGQQQADFINCVVWRKIAENVERYCSKGSLVGIEGRLQSRTYDNAQGQKVFVVEVLGDNVQFLENKKSNDQQVNNFNNDQQFNNFNNDQSSMQLENEFNNSLNTFDIMEDDIQF